MTNHYAICDCNGPISARLRTDDHAEEICQSQRRWCDGCYTQVEDECGFDFTGISFDDAVAALVSGGGVEIVSERASDEGFTVLRVIS